MRVLVGADGSIGGQVAVRWATAFARAAGAELVVVSVWHPGFAEVSPDEFEALRAEAVAALDDRCAAARAKDVPLRGMLREGDARQELLAAADTEAADLVVVGARGMGDRTHAMHVGSVTHHLVHHSRHPIAAIPPAARAAWPARVVVGVDGSDGSRRAVAWCAASLGSIASEVVGVHAEEPLAEWVPHADPRSWFRKAQEHAKQWLAPIGQAGIAARPLVAEGSPVDALTDAALAEEAGMVVVGSRGVGGITGLRLGSTALKVLHHVHLPVVVVPSEAM